MRSIWKGAITFGLVNVPVKLYSATEDHDVSLHQVHDEDGGRIRYQRRCEICGNVVDYQHIDKAYDDGEHTVVITREDLKSLPEERSREIDVVEFVPSEQVDPIMYDRSYFLEPDSASPKAYALLRETLEKTDRTAIVHFALRQKTRLAALRVRGDVLVLQTLLWDDEVREATFPALDERVTLSAKELQMSSQLVKSFESDFEPGKFTDDYQEQLRELIEAKIEQGDTFDTAATFGEAEEGDGGGEVLDLMEALRRSVEKNRASSGGKATSSGAKDAPAASSDSDDDDDESADADAPPKRKPAAGRKAAPKASDEKPARKTPARKKAPATTASADAENESDGAEPEKKKPRRKSA
ncbi:non-homologous end joining protein Ku [Planctomonas psychrotolerans]|uniref:non-homologous end joining protein Ku n=1 Tax=Planctomonas psychrotolerans TaxID=2528712 RepID=UPI00123A667E|nr:Ku protein [Planctomonas psychrotolerans]